MSIMATPLFGNRCPGLLESAWRTAVPRPDGICRGSRTDRSGFLRHQVADRKPEQVHPRPCTGSPTRGLDHKCGLQPARKRRRLADTGRVPSQRSVVLARCSSKVLVQPVSTIKGRILMLAVSRFVREDGTEMQVSAFERLLPMQLQVQCRPLGSSRGLRHREPPRRISSARRGGEVPRDRFRCAAAATGTRNAPPLRVGRLAWNENALVAMSETLSRRPSRAPAFTVPASALNPICHAPSRVSASMPANVVPAERCPKAPSATAPSRDRGSSACRP